MSKRGKASFSVMEFNGKGMVNSEIGTAQSPHIMDSLGKGFNELDPIDGLTTKSFSDMEEKAYVKWAKDQGLVRESIDCVNKMKTKEIPLNKIIASPIQNEIKVGMKKVGKREVRQEVKSDLNGDK